jgi:hypothetical protein
VTLLEIIRQAREYLDDPHDPYESDEWASDDDGLRWQNKGLTALCNAAIKEVVDEFPIRDTMTLAVTAGTAEYPYPQDYLIGITGARLDGEDYPLVKTDTMYMDASYSGWRNDSASTPQCFFVDIKSRHINLWPTPVADGSLLLEVERYPVADLAWSNRLTATPEIPPRFHRHLAHYIAGHAFQKQDGDTHRSSNAANHLGQWRQAIGGGRSAHQMHNRDFLGGRKLRVRGRQR